MTPDSGKVRSALSVTENLTPLFSLVIATLGRRDTLRACLESLKGEVVHDFELIVVDQNEDDRVVEVVSEYRQYFPIDYCRYPLKNASLARNAGASRSHGLWCGFPDDDCRFEPSTLDAVRGEVRRGEADLITGMMCDAGGTPVLLDWYPTRCNITNACLRRTAAESALYVRREFFDSVGGFDEVFGPGGLFYAEEGIDFIRRLWTEHGLAVRMRYSPSIRLVHQDASWYADEDAVRRAYRYSLGRGASFARHWKQASLRRLMAETAKHLIGCIVLRGLRRTSRLKSLFGNVVGFILYHRWRYEKRQAFRLGGGRVAH